MYQMYVYQKKYQAQSVTLLYPMTDKVDRSEPIIYCANDGVTVRAEFIDLMNIESGMDDLEKILRGRDV
jgi:5-methylcytosine-specific restriction enzyme subunit McrC